MSVFNSLGSNYSFSFALKALFTRNKIQYSDDLKSFLKDKYGGEAILLYKGREALKLALKVLDLPKGSFVAINGFTCYAVYEAIIKTGYKVEYIDIEKQELNFSPKGLIDRLNYNPEIKVVIIQNTLGYPCEALEIEKICRDRKIFLIEDLAHSAGAYYKKEKEAGTIGDFVVLSFSQDKMIDSISGGALIVRNKQYLESPFNLVQIGKRQQAVDRLYPLFTYLIRKTYDLKVGKVLHLLLRRGDLLSSPMNGLNGKGLCALQLWYCCLARIQFKNLKNLIEHRRQIANIYAKTLNSEILSPSIVSSISRSTNLRFPIFVDKRDDLIKSLRKHNIFISDIWYDAPIAPKRYMKLTDYNRECSQSEVVSSRILNLPTHINVTEDDAKNIARLINKWLKSQ